MASRFSYSRWDGLQKGFDLDADHLMQQVTDDLLYHGDMHAALRRLMQEGMEDRNGDRIQGLREMMEKLRQKRQETLVVRRLRSKRWRNVSSNSTCCRPIWPVR
jgi:hypothetical protein